MTADYLEPREPRAGSASFLLILLAIILPPLAVALSSGLGGRFWLNILLTLLGYIPGLVHAIWVVAKTA
ncbi:MAG: YqaE/Pmp3 family membrane protein [Desulfarculaceae bacterium]|nr:YqaE/Pmp3 family membrane protein [Desulfarculaceae bacterium]